MLPPSLEDIAQFIRECQGIATARIIGAETLLEQGLGITGDDGIALLHAAEKKFGITFTRQSFELDPDEYLFHGEGFDLSGIFSLFTGRTVRYRSLTVGKLHAAIKRELALQAD